MTIRSLVAALAAALAAGPSPARAAEPSAASAAPAAVAPTKVEPDGGEAWPLPQGATLEVPARASPYARPPARRMDLREPHFAQPGETVDASDALDEIVDEVAADVARIGAARVSPIVLERVQLSSNLDPGVAQILEARLAAALRRAADAVLIRCVECDATRAEVVDASWVVSRGVTRREQAQAIARRYGAKTFLRAALTARTTPASMSLDVELVRAEDAAIAYAESYRFGGDDAMLYRGADRAQLREQRLKELEDRLNERPHWGYAAHLGYLMIPRSRDSDIQGPYGALRLDERFGANQEHRIAITAGGFDGSNAGFSGGLVQIGLATRVSAPSVWGSTLHLGAAVGWLIAGSMGNAPLVAATAEYRIGTRLGAHAQLGYLAKFKYMNRPEGPEIGGLVPEVGVSFLW
jgi:hypothetical protein